MSESHRNNFDHVIGLPITTSMRSEKANTALVELSDKADKQPLLNITLSIIVVKTD